MIGEGLSLYDHPTAALFDAIDLFSSEINTAIPAIIQSFDPVAMTVTAQPAIQVKQKIKGREKDINLPLLVDCPVFFPSGGGYSLTFPIQKGDECLIVFSQRCIDAWWQHGGIQPQAECRMHDMSDGFAFVGVFSQKKVLPNVSTTSIQLRSNDGNVSLDISSTGITLDSGRINLKGAVSVSTGATGTFVDMLGNIITVQNGIVTNIV